MCPLPLMLFIFPISSSWSYVRISEIFSDLRFARNKKKKNIFIHIVSIFRYQRKSPPFFGWLRTPVQNDEAMKVQWFYSARRCQQNLNTHMQITERSVVPTLLWNVASRCTNTMKPTCSSLSNIWWESRSDYKYKHKTDNDLVGTQRMAHHHLRCSNWHCVGPMAVINVKL